MYEGRGVLPRPFLSVGRTREPRTSEYEVTGDGQRLDRYLVDCLADVSRAQVQAWIRTEAVTVNGRPAKASTRLAAGDRVRVSRPEEPAATLELMHWRTV